RGLRGAKILPFARLAGKPRGHRAARCRSASDQAGRSPASTPCPQALSLRGATLATAAARRTQTRLARGRPSNHPFLRLFFIAVNSFSLSRGKSRAAGLGARLPSL